MSEKSVSRRLLLFSDITSLDYVSTSPFRTLLDIIQRMADGVFAALDAFLRSAFDGLSEFSFHFVFHAISGLQIHKHQLRGDQQNHQRG